jgi:lysozyme
MVINIRDMVMAMGNIIDQLIRDEGFELKPYVDTVGKVTIGVGRNLTDNGISSGEAIFLLNNDINGCIVDLKSNFDFFMGLSTERQNVLINMCFNLGINRLKSFKKMLSAIKEGDFVTASIEMLDSKWSRQVGDRANRLADLMR